MLRSKPSRLSRLLLVGLAALVLRAAAGCASADDAQALLTIRRTVARYCAGHRATAGELTGATLESLYEIDPDARQADGTTVQQSATALERRLRACGAHTAAKRLAKLTA